MLLVVGLPGIWTRARTIEGTLGPPGSDSAPRASSWYSICFLQGNLPALYTNRWKEIGGEQLVVSSSVVDGRHLLVLRGGWILANQTRKSGAPSLPGLAILLSICTVVFGVIAVVVGFPGAGWNVPTFGVAVLPGLALATTISVLGARKA